MSMKYKPKESWSPAAGGNFSEFQWVVMYLHFTWC